MSQFAVDVFRRGDRVCDFRPQEFSETLAEPVHRHFHAPFGQVQMSGNLSVRFRDCIRSPSIASQRHHYHERPPPTGRHG